MAGDDLFEGLDFSMPADNTAVIVKTTEATVTPPAKDTKKEARIAKLREELAGVNEKHSEEIAVQRAEADEKAKIKKVADDTRNANKIVIDVQNLDERKSLWEHMQQGRLVVDTKDRPFIVAEQPSKIYNPFKGPVHRVYADEIIRVCIRKIYMDLETMPAGSRTLLTESIWLHHTGYEGWTVIGPEQLQYLLDNGLIDSKIVTYSFADASTGGCYYLGTNGKEPTKEKIAQLEQEQLADHNKINAKSFSVSLEVPEETETVEENTLDSVLEDIEL